MKRAISLPCPTWVAGAICATLLALPSAVTAREAMKMKDKESLYERVIVRDRVRAADGPKGAEGEVLLPLQALYVYARDDGWAELGLEPVDARTFWAPEEALTSWNQNIVVTMEGSENLGRLMFFADEDELYDVIESENPGIASAPLREEAEAAEAGGAPSDHILALGPREVIDQRENLYVMPILHSEEAVFENGTFVNVLKVAIARASNEKPAVKIAPPAGGGDRTDFKAAVVFVVDTTLSMEPYIRGTKAAIEEIYKNVAGGGNEGSVSFGLIGYRDSLKAAPGLEYDVKTFVNLDDGFSSERFLDGISQMAEAKSSSRNFREDSYAGVEYAISALDWAQFGARFIVLVTDAGPREANDEYSSTGLSAEGLNNVVRERLGAAIAIMHLKTKGGAEDHDSAEAAYRELARQPNLPPLYFAVDGGDPATYRAEAGQLGQLIVDQVSAFRSGEEIPDGGGSDDDLTRAVRSAGRTMQLAYLGRKDGVTAPDVFEAYVSDRDFERTGLKPLSVRLLISKRQLSDLDEALRIIIEQSEENITEPDQFFAQVLGAAADMSRDPDKVTRNGDANLADAVAISEYLDGLPYRSRIMNVTEADWLTMSFSEQQIIINGLYDKVERYRRYNEATDQWVDYLGTGADAESLLYPMPLDDLP
ncbi:MAG: VWA domain-containing protein [Rhodobacteraceae bacterium]|nr:VWA domain-containing protein [Paracoccaceae bacterium]